MDETELTGHEVSDLPGDERGRRMGRGRGVRAGPVNVPGVQHAVTVKAAPG